MRSGKAASRQIWPGRRAAVRLAHWLEARKPLGLKAEALFCTISRQRARGRVTPEGFAAGTEVVELEPGRPISAGYVRQLLTRLAERAGLEQRVTPHTLRHSFATHLLCATGNLKLVQQALRHQDVTTTARIYAHLQEEDVAEAVRGLRAPPAPARGEAHELAATDGGAAGRGGLAASADDEEARRARVGLRRPTVVIPCERRRHERPIVAHGAEQPRRPAAGS